MREQRHLQQRLNDAEQQRQQSRLAARPYQDALSTAEQAVTRARTERRLLAEHLATARRRDRRSIRPEIVVADRRVEAANAAEQQAVRAAQPAMSAVATAGDKLTELRRVERREQLFARWTSGPDNIHRLERRLEALDTWQQWANGATIEPNRLAHTSDTLFVVSDPTGQLTRLHNTMLAHPATRDLLRQGRPEITHPPVPEISIQ